MSHAVAQSGFFPTEVLGHLRPSAQIIQWNIAAPDPSGRRHVESGSYRKRAHLTNVGGFTAQKESGLALDFGDVFIPGEGSGFETDTVAITFNMGDVNSNVNSRFDRMYNNGSGTASTQLTAFNFRIWIGNLNAFNVVSYSGVNKDPVQTSPVFHYRESAQWRKGYVLQLTDASGSPISGVAILPSGMPDCPNVFSREDDISVSGAYLDREFTNFVYLRGFFPDLPSGHFYKLGTYGALGQGDFTLKFSYDYTSKDANIIDPTDTKDVAISVEKSFPLQTLVDGSGWWQLNEASPKLAAQSGFSIDQGYTFAQVDMTLNQFVNGGGSVGRHTGIVSSGTASGFAMNLRSNRNDVVRHNNDACRTTNFDGDDPDGNTGFTYTGWIALNDPSGADPAATGVGSVIPTLDTGVLCRWNSSFSSSSRQYRCFYSREFSRFFWTWETAGGFRRPLLPYNYMAVDSQDNGHGEFTSFGNIQGTGGGAAKHRWYFVAFGYNPNGDGSPGGDMFFRVNDGPIDRLPICDDVATLRDTDGGAAPPPFSIGSNFTRTAGNGTYGPGAGQYDNFTLHRRPLTNTELLDLYNNGRGQEYPVGNNRVIDFSLPPEIALNNVDPDPVPLRRSLRHFFNFSDASGVTHAADSQRYSDLQPNNAQQAAGSISGNFMPTSGIIINEFPVFSDLASASGALQIRSVDTPFDDGQPGNNVWWELSTASQVGAIGDCDRTWAAWVRFKKAGDSEIIMAQWSAAGNNRYWQVAKDSSDNIQFARANGTTIGQPPTIDTPPEFAASFTPNRWYFVWAQIEMPDSGSTATVSINAYDPVQNETFTTSTTSSFHWGDTETSVPITIGAQETIGTALVADIDLAMVGMWYRKLTSNEILQLINSGNGLNFGAPGFSKITRVYWDSQLKRDNDPSTL